jgi:hypothetical protein
LTHVTELVAQYVADRAQFARPAQPGAQQVGLAVAAAVAKAGEVDGDQRQDRRIGSNGRDLIVGGQAQAVQAETPARERRLILARQPGRQRQDQRADGPRLVRLAQPLSGIILDHPGVACAHANQVYDLLQRHQVPLIEDDVYAELYFGAQPPKPVKSFDRDGLVMHCGSFSKCLVPGYRVRWVAGGRYAKQIGRLKLMTTISPSVPAQAAIADYLQHGGFDRHLRKLRHLLETQQASMLASAARHFPASTRVTRPSGGYFLWFEFPEQVDSLQLFRLALAQGISLAPGPIFSATRRFGNCALELRPPLDAGMRAGDGHARAHHRLLLIRNRSFI